MKIAYLFSRYPVPSQTFCDTEIRALEAAGHEIEIYSCSPPKSSFRHGGPADWPRAQVFYAPPAPILEIWADAARCDGSWPEAMVAEHEARFGLSYDPARRARHAVYFADRLRRRGVGHLHVHFANRATHAALFIHALTGVPFSFTAHAQDFLVDLGNDDLLRLMCERAAFIVTVSKWSRRALIERCPNAKRKIHWVYNGIDLVRWTLPVTVPKIPDQPLRIFSVGRLIEFKGFQDLIVACGLLRERGVPFSCEIAGEGPWREALERQAAGIGEIQLIGLQSQAEVRWKMENCDVFALPCRVDDQGACDVLPTVILEAMACAKPVVSTFLAAVPEMVEHGKTGFLVPTANPVALADALADLAANSEKRRLLGATGRQKLATRFDAAKSAQELSALFVDSKAAGSFRPNEIPGQHVLPDVVCIADRLPRAGAASPERVKTIVLQAGKSSAPDFAEIRSVECLPDDVVLETFWRLNDPMIHQMESWREEAGGGLPTSEFLLACRRAWYLRRTQLRGTHAPRHLHVIGPEALLCGWLLRRLGGSSTASFLLPGLASGGLGIAGSVVRKLSVHFVGGWTVNERKLADSLGSNFSADQPDAAALQLTWADRTAR